MNKLLLISLLLLVVFSCKDDENPQETSNKIPTVDTIIVKEEIVKGMQGFSRRGRSIRYFVITGSDTSSFRPNILQDNKTGTVHIYLNELYGYNKLPQKRKLNELKQILEIAKQDFPLDSLNSISIANIIFSSDLEIELTKKFEQNKKNRLNPHKFIREFLYESDLTKKVNRLLKPYNKSVESYGTEKYGFIDRNEFLSHYNTIKDTIEVPERILSSATYIYLKDD